VTNLQIPLIAAFFDPSSVHFSVAEQARKQKQGLACNQRYVAPALLSTPTEVLIALTKSDEELKSYQFLTKDLKGREVNLALVEELEKVPVEYRLARAKEALTMTGTMEAITEALDVVQAPDFSESEHDLVEDEEFDYGSIMELEDHICPNPTETEEPNFL
jgi:hypothetical protein